MSLTVFVALCVVGIDFLIYVLFQWTYADKRAAMARKLAAQRNAMEQEVLRPFVVSSRKGGPETQARIRRVRERMTGHGARATRLA
jgi:hypothetical protein